MCIFELHLNNHDPGYGPNMQSILGPFQGLIALSPLDRRESVVPDDMNVGKRIHVFLSALA